MFTYEKQKDSHIMSYMHQDYSRKKNSGRIFKPKYNNNNNNNEKGSPKNSNVKI